MPGALSGIGRRAQPSADADMSTKIAVNTTTAPSSPSVRPEVVADLRAEGGKCDAVELVDEVESEEDEQRSGRFAAGERGQPRPQARHTGSSAGVSS